MGYLKLLRAIVKQSMMDIWEYQRMEANGQNRKTDSYWAVKAEAYRKKDVGRNYESARAFILKFFGENTLDKIENGSKLKRAA